MRTNCPTSWQPSHTSLDSHSDLDRYPELWLFFNGRWEPSSKGGRATYGFVVRTDENAGLVVGEGNGVAAEGKRATCNMAEWEALTSGIFWLAERDWKGTLHVRGSSQVVVYQLIGQYKCKAENLKDFLSACKLMLRGFKRWEAQWIRRWYNGPAHKLSKAA